jgi:hypothetical protein
LPASVCKLSPARRREKQAAGDSPISLGILALCRVVEKKWGVAERREMIKYTTFRAKGWQIGSGPTEATCKTLTARLKGSGMRWDATMRRLSWPLKL